MENGSRDRTNVIVVGGGLAGLISASIIARGGRSVTLLERSSTLGGRGMTTKLGDFEFNLGPHAVYKKGALARVLKEIGVSYSGKVPANTGYAIKDGALHDVGLNPKWFLTSKLIGSRSELLRVFMRIRSMDTTRYAGMTTGQWLDSEIRDPGVRSLITGLLRVSTYANDLELDASIALAQLQMGQAGVLYLDHGWQTMIDGLRTTAERAGAVVETNASVEAIERQGAHHIVRLKDGRALPTDAIVLAVTPDIASKLTDSAALRSFVQNAVQVRAACLDLGMRKLPFPDRQFAFGLDTPLYFSVHSRAAQLAPKGQVMLQVAKYLAPGDTDAKAHEQQLEALMDLVQPGWRSEVAQKRYLPNMTVVPQTPTVQQGGLAGRPDVEAAGIPNVFIAGDWVGGEGWLSDASAASAKRVAERILQQALAPATNLAATPVVARA